MTVTLRDLRYTIENPATRIIFLAIHSHLELMQGQPTAVYGFTHIPYDAIAEETGVSVATISRHINDLVRAGAFEKRVVMPGPGRLVYLRPLFDLGTQPPEVPWISKNHGGRRPGAGRKPYKQHKKRGDGMTRLAAARAVLAAAGRRVEA